MNPILKAAVDKAREQEGFPIPSVKTTSAAGHELARGRRRSRTVAGYVLLAARLREALALRRKRLAQQRRGKR